MTQPGTPTHQIGSADLERMIGRASDAVAVHAVSPLATQLALAREALEQQGNTIRAVVKERDDARAELARLRAAHDASLAAEPDTAAEPTPSPPRRRKPPGDG